MRLIRRRCTLVLVRYSMEWREAMLFKNAARLTLEMTIAPDVAPAPSARAVASSDKERAQAELRRQMYERIAQGNALAEVEEHADRKWNGRLG